MRRLRRALADGPAIHADGTGYHLVADHRQLDVHDFHRLAGAGELAAALDCWRGPVLADVPGLQHHPAAVALQQCRPAVALRYADDATCGAEAVDRLGPIAAAEPLHEGLQARYIRALAGAGRQAEAVAADAERASTMGIALVSGMAGVGKPNPGI